MRKFEIKSRPGLPGRYSLNCWCVARRRAGVLAVSRVGGRVHVVDWGKAALGDVGARPVFRSAATRRRFCSPRLVAANLRTGDESPAAKSGSELPHSENDATDQSTRVGWPRESRSIHGAR